jgi:CheY-like chemotaxis protein
MRRVRILVVDDHQMLREALVGMLELSGFEVVGAVGDGAEATSLAAELEPDVVLMDLSLPVMDGWEATRKIKANHELKHIPIIAVTSHAMAGDEVEARKAGCDDYLPKPIDEDELWKKIRKFLD